MKIFGLALALIVTFGPAGAEVLTGHVVGVTVTEPDDANMVIIRAFRDRLRADQPKIH